MGGTCRTKCEVDVTTQFKKDLKLLRRQRKDESKLHKVVDMLVNGEELPQKYHDHQLVGEYMGCRDCHIEPDRGLIYKKKEETLVLLLTRTGSHSDLF